MSYKPGDIVAVYGESAVGDPMNDNHEMVGSVDLLESSDMAHVIEKATRWHTCEVKRVLPSLPHGFVLIVEKVSARGKYFPVLSKQCRIMEREGNAIRATPAKYIAAYREPTGDERDFFVVVDNLDRAKAEIRSWKEDYDHHDDDEDEHIEGDWEVYKGIRITSEVRL